MTLPSLSSFTSTCRLAAVLTPNCCGKVTTSLKVAGNCEVALHDVSVDIEDGGEVYRGGGSGFGGRTVLGGLGRAAVGSIFAYRTEAVTQQEVVPLIGESVRLRESARIGV